jgi:DNA repair protein RadC
MYIQAEDERAAHLRETLAAYQFDAQKLRQLAQGNAELAEALRTGDAPEELVLLLSVFASLLQPSHREQIKSPTDAASQLMLEMSYLDQEQMRVLCLDTKNLLQKIHTVYKGSLNTTSIRVGELFKEPIRLNSASVILAHNHPSGDPTPSTEDVLLTRQVVEAGKLLDCGILDYLVIGQGKYVSMRERGLGFSS